MKEFIVNAKPVSVNELYGMNNGRKFLSKEGRYYKNAIISAIGKVDYIFDMDVYVNFEFSITGDKDVDNLLKASIDALTEANIFYDDKQITRLVATKNRMADDNMVKIQVFGHTAKANGKSHLLIFGKIAEIDEYLKEKKKDGFKVIMGRKEIFINGDKYVCVSKRQIKKIDTTKYEEIQYEKK